MFNISYKEHDTVVAHLLFEVPDQPRILDSQGFIMFIEVILHILVI